MKRIILISTFILLFIPSYFYSQDENKAKEESYCILRIYTGITKGARGIFIVHEDLKVEEKELESSHNRAELLKATTENINLIKNKGYTLVSSNIVPAGDLHLYEYTFRKTQN